MSDDKTIFESVPLDHAISRMANSLFDAHRDLAAAAGISPMDACVALSNSIGMILASSEDMPRDKAFKRMDDLRRVVESAYDLFDVKGTG